MPRPKGKKRPADVVGAAVMVAKIATGEIEEGNEPETKAAAAWQARRQSPPSEPYAAPAGRDCQIGCGSPVEKGRL
jgi:hypothetical protein